MNRQKVCIIGGGLTGLITSIVISKLGINVDLVTNKTSNKIKSNRTTAISQNNYNFLKKLKIFNSSSSDFWPSSKMELYTQNEKNNLLKIFEMNKKEKKILYMIKNSKLITSMTDCIKKNKLISLKKIKSVSGIINSGLLKGIESDSTNKKYNLIIICTGQKSNIVQSIFGNQKLEKSYNEVSITTTISHVSTPNLTVRQFFLDNGILAFLPLENTKTSVVWSMKKNNINNIKKQIKFFAEIYFQKIKFIDNLEFRDLNFLIRKKYHNERVLLFGDALHVVHPLAGQGFNMVLRDLSSLEKTIRKKISLGLDVGSEEILSEFSKETKPMNFLYSMGINQIKNCFSTDKYYFKNFRNKIIKNINRNNFLKDLFYNLADKGLKL